MIASREDIAELVEFILQNKDCNKEELGEMLWGWTKNKNRCQCSRCTGLPDIESYYDDIEEGEGI